MSVMVRGKVAVYDGEAWIENQETDNPAWAYADLLRGAINLRALPDARLDGDALKAWADECDELGLTYHYIHDRANTVFQALQQIAFAGKATYAMNDGLHSVLVDKPRETIGQHFSPRNTWDNVTKRTFAEEIHGLRVHFTDGEDTEFGEATHEITEMIVYADGYSATGEGDDEIGTKFEALDIPFVNNREQAFHLARVLLKAIELRPEVHTFKCDVEHIANQRGDRVLYSAEQALIGITAGRVTSIMEEAFGDRAGQCTGIFVDEFCPMESGIAYGVRIRRADGTDLQELLQPYYGETANLLRFKTPIPPEDPWPEEGDLFLFGEYEEEAIDAVITSIEHDGHLNAKISVVPHAPEIHDPGPCPPFNPHITHPPSLEQLQPALPSIVRVITDESALIRGIDGSFESRIVILLTYWGATGRVSPHHVEAQYRIQIEDPLSQRPWERCPLFEGAPARIAIGEVQDGYTYEIRIRAVSPHHVAGPWVGRSDILVIGKETLPADITEELVVEPSEGLIRWIYADPPPDLAGYLVRYRMGSSEDWENAQKAAEGVISGTAFPVAALPPGEVTVMVKPVDVAGNEAENAATLTLTVPEDDYQSIDVQGTVTGESGSWSWGSCGLIAGGSVDPADGYLKGDEIDPGEPDTYFWTGNDESPFWPTPGSSAFWEGGGGPGGPWGDAIFVLWANQVPGYGQTATATRIAAIPDVEAGDPLMDYYYIGGPVQVIPWPGRVVDKAANTSPYIRIRIPGGATRPVLRGLRVVTDALWITEVQTNVSLSAGGTELTLTRSYQEIKLIDVSIQDEGGASNLFSVRVVDYGDPTGTPVVGPTLQGYDENGNAVAGTVRVKIWGV
jgi:hypothetical protein